MAKKKNAVRKDGLIPKQIFLGRDAEGKRKYKSVYARTQKDADAQAEEVRASLRKGLDVSAGNDTFEKWAGMWLKTEKVRVSRNWYVARESAVDHLNRYLRHMPISKILMADIQNILIDLAANNPNTGKPTAKRTLANIESVARGIFDYAISNRLFEYNPVTSVKPPMTAKPQKRRALTDAEQQWILNTEHRAKTAAMIMMYSGLRRGELIPLMWNDIDLKARTISVTKSVELVNNVFVAKDGTKTEDPRVVDIPLRLVGYLSRQKREGLYVCVNAKGTMHTESSWSAMWESYLGAINRLYGDFSPFQNKPTSKFDPKGTPFVIPRFTPHWLRHTFCTIMYHAGVDILTAMRQMGHKDVKTTLGIYSHLDSVFKRNSMLKVDGFLNNASKMQVVDY